ncbi:methionine/alanine import family NSS transporter small subunit [Mobilicoccus sp.]|uniref:methionine/alanine import family NSS transporter small subunit n=1 Tax=Mobilicoccus sp. TaxID=2034349 RepID=UPI0028A068DD|nr:methionine/alanine import family NSS transporter small subunit [Mobilicoccus sp.]
MTPLALTFLVLSITLVWGGLALSIVALVRSSRATAAELGETDHDGVGPDRR